MCVLGISDLTTASMYDVAVGIESGHKSARICISSINVKVWSSVNPRFHHLPLHNESIGM